MAKASKDRQYVRAQRRVERLLEGGWDLTGEWFNGMGGARALLNFQRAIWPKRVANQAGSSCV